MRGPFREFGLAAGLLYCVDRVLSRLTPQMRLYVYELVVQPVPAESVLPRRLGKQLEIREIKPGDPEISLMPVRPEMMRLRLAQNAVCLGAYRKGEFIGYMWFCPIRYEEDEVRCTYVLASTQDSVFDFDFYLFPQYRMGSGFIGLWNGANEILSRRGVRYTFSRLARFNTASRRAHRHLGCEVVGRTLFLQAWRLEVMLASLFPYVHVSMKNSRRVHLTLRPNALRA